MPLCSCNEETKAQYLRHGSLVEAIIARMARVRPEIPLRWRALIRLIRALPQGMLSRTAGRLADLPIPRPLRRHVLGLFARTVGADASEAELPLEEYATINRFFVRRLAENARTLPSEAGCLVSPVDGVLSQLGSVTNGRIIQVKGRTYTVSALLDDPEEAERYQNGSFITIYLSPRHYHRIHSPAEGTIFRARHVPGLLLPVNPPSAMLSPELYARNERLVCHLETHSGRVVVVAVGALNVGRISAAFDAGWNTRPRRDPAVTNQKGARATTRGYEPGVAVRLGEEIMAFHLGSSVVMLLEPGMAALAQSLAPEHELRMGEPVAWVSSRENGRETRRASSRLTTPPALSALADQGMKPR